ncbi:MAG: VOC family protein [Deltaproteobacteria bacterium]|nr:VOC family protein [Deltaproteobacteria bacterium]
MIRLSHIAIACPQIEFVMKQFERLGLELEAERSVEVASEKVKVAFVPIEPSDELRIELLQPTADSSAVAKFLSDRPKGGLHHLSFEVSNIDQWKVRLENAGVEILPPGLRKGARGTILFIHPRSMGGVLVELEQLIQTP